MPRFPQRFVKLFDFGEEGQLLVQCLQDDAQEPALSIATVSVQGVAMTVTPSFRSEQARDEQFLAFDESKALFQFHAMQETLANATA